MQLPHQKQLYLGSPSVTQVALNHNCRDRMIPILRGLQHIYSPPRCRPKTEPKTEMFSPVDEY
jgi:hypothetical protein